MKIYSLGTDKGGWGQLITSLARDRGHEAETFTIAEEVPRGSAAPHYIFTRIPQFPPALEEGIRTFGHLWDRGESRFIMDLDTVRYYEDKLAQSEAYIEWMPGTLVNILDDDGMPKIPLVEFLQMQRQLLGFPFIAKASFGSASANVRLITNHKEAVANLFDAFGGDGIPSRRGGAAVQKDHVIWQKFLPGNEYDYRAVITGNLVMLLRRYNRDDRPMASGSGKVEPVVALDSETRAVLDRSFEFFRANKIKWGGIDLVCWSGEDETGMSRRQPDNWKVLETTLGWSQRAYGPCQYFDANGNTMLYKGRDMFNLLLTCIEQGVWA